MQAAKNTAATVKETASNVTASACSGMEKTKATAQEKVDKMKAHDEAEKQMALEKKQERIERAELNKEEAREHNAAVRQATATAGHLAPTPTGGTATYSTTGATGQPTGAHQKPAMPGHGTGEPAGGYVVEGSEMGMGHTTVPDPHATRLGTDSTCTLEERGLGD